eukprot:CAMPEP_0174853566 /NCGR_PEP_ID=MMETSP1114-20130205/28976_1 /TAXON_ID=312471 /ORGANISM="Neobodo designis, Strain CCAP 1951/1" /LENGTH=478 /DNA_ID=CAMNT_0016088221 /DNA_START=35 /DNA_END=1471 /DNA_ORIENTATION=+
MLPKCSPIPLVRKMFSEQRERLAKAMGNPVGEFALYKGGGDVPRNSSDTCFSWRQESYFFHMFGVEIMDCLGAVDLRSGEGIVFIPRLPDEYAVWMGALPTPESVKASSEVEHVYFVDEAAAALKKHGCTALHILDGSNSDSGIKVAAPSLDAFGDFDVKTERLFLVHTQLRVVKTDLECAFFGALNKVASAAHVQVMQQCKSDWHENQLEAAFLSYCMAAAQCKCLAYGGIAASGKGPAILHYVDNNRKMESGDMVLVDFGGELHCFASDITCSFPCNGKFTPTQRTVYEGVLAAHDAVLESLKPGVSWVDMHLLALRTMGRMLRDGLGVIRGDATDEEIEKSGLMAAFQPHGLGHLIGLEVHDVGGYIDGVTPPRGKTPMTSKLRTARTMEENILITVEPGCYFNQVTLEAALRNADQSPLLVEDALRRDEVWNFGGVRIESNVRITGAGCLNYTNVPRKVEDIEAVMAGTKAWPQ